MFKTLCFALVSFLLSHEFCLAQMPEVSGTPVELLAMRYIDISPGAGTPAASGKQFTVHYTGWLRDGTRFDSSLDRHEPFQFVQGRRQVIAGWEAGFEGMKAGGKRRLFIPYQLAYGEKGTGPIPPKAELIFDVELLAVNDVPAQSAAVDTLTPLAELEAHTVELAKAMPEEKYSWRPAPAVRSFGEVMLHIANGNNLILKFADSQPSGEELGKAISANVNLEKQALSKERTIALLVESFAAVRKKVEPLRAGALGQEVDFFGQKVTHRTVLVFLDTHAAEHLGQAIAYARMNGVVPPWSR